MERHATVLPSLFGMNLGFLRSLTMLRGCNRLLPAMAMSLGIWVFPASAAEAANKHPLAENYQPPGRDVIWGLDRVEWGYRGDVIVTDVQGRFCEGFKCAHGRGRLTTDGSWGYSGTFRYGDIVGKGEMWDDDGEYLGLVSSKSFPGGPAPLCGEPITWIQFYADAPPCAGRACMTSQCLKAWVRRVDRGEVLPRDEAQRNRRWYEEVRAAQLALLEGQSRRTFEKVLLAGTDIREFLVGRGWKPLADARVYILRYLHPTAESDRLSLIMSGFETPYLNNPTIQVSEILPMELWTGASVAVVADPWTAIGLRISINRSGYVVSLPGQSR